MPAVRQTSCGEGFFLGYYQAADPDDEDNILYKSDDVVVEDEFPECRECYWNSDGVVKWEEFAQVQ